MHHYALGWAHNLNDIFVRFPYEKCKELIDKYRTKFDRRRKIKQVFRDSVDVILNDIIENNASFTLPTLGWFKGEIHYEPVKGELFKDLRAKGKFAEIDFLETMFTGYLLYLYIKKKKDNLSPGKKYPIYISKVYKEKMEKLVNEGKTYC